MIFSSPVVTDSLETDETRECDIYGLDALAEASLTWQRVPGVGSKMHSDIIVRQTNVDVQEQQVPWGGGGRLLLTMCRKSGRLSADTWASRGAGRAPVTKRRHRLQSQLAITQIQVPFNDGSSLCEVADISISRGEVETRARFVVRKRVAWLWIQSVFSLKKLCFYVSELYERYEKTMRQMIKYIIFLSKR